MISAFYETHQMPNRHLPFIFHPTCKLTPPESLANWHENIELLYCTSGSGYIRCGTRMIPFLPGELIVVNADTLHSFGTDRELCYQCLIIDNSFFHSNGVPIESLYFQDKICDESIVTLFRKIVFAYEQLNPDDYLTVLQIRASMLNLVEALCQKCTVFRPEGQHSDHVNRAITYLRQNFDKPITLDQLADFVGISKYHLSRQFRLFTGSTVIKTINAMRCAQALQLIREGMQVSDAARACGFENLSYFTRVFFSLYNKLPSQCIPET